MYIVASRTWDSQVVVTYGYLCTICFVNAVARVLSFSCHYLKKSVGANDLTTYCQVLAITSYCLC